MHNDLPFGGLAVIAMGDFFQQGPVGKSLVQASMNPLDPIGQLFKKFRVIEFTKQERAADDPIHSQRLDYFRNPSCSLTPVLESDILSHLQPLAATDLMEDPLFSVAPIICSDNVTRHAINKLKVFEFAKSVGAPIVAIRLPLSDYSTSAFTASSIRTGRSYESLLDEHDDLTFYFVRGAPVMCKDNVSPTFGIANGSQAILHSLTLNAENCKIDDVWAEIDATPPGEVVYLKELPLSINIQLKNDDDDIDIDTMSTLVPGSKIIPMLLNMRSPRKLKVAKQARRLRQLTFFDYGVDLAFALTYFKVQGLTLDRVILDLDTTVMPRINVAAIYVGLSRVRMAKHIRILPTTNACRLTLKQLRFKPYLVEWLRNFNT